MGIRLQSLSQKGQFSGEMEGDPRRGFCCAGEKIPEQLQTALDQYCQCVYATEV